MKDQRFWGKIQKNAALIFWAEIAGNKAFKEGRKRVPSQDRECVELLTGLEVGQGTPVMKGWLRGWDAANLGGKYE